MTTDNWTDFCFCVKTVGELVDALSKFPQDAQLTISANWYDRNNFNTVKQNIYMRDKSGISLCIDVCSIGNETNLVRISNENTKDMEME